MGRKDKARWLRSFAHPSLSLRANKWRGLRMKTWFDRAEIDPLVIQDRREKRGRAAALQRRSEDRGPYEVRRAREGAWGGSRAAIDRLARAWENEKRGWGSRTPKAEWGHGATKAGEPKSTD